MVKILKGKISASRNFQDEISRVQIPQSPSLLMELLIGCKISKRQAIVFVPLVLKVTPLYLSLSPAAMMQAAFSNTP